MSKEIAIEVGTAYIKFLETMNSIIKANPYMEPELCDAIKDMVAGSTDLMVEVGATAERLDEEDDEEDAPERLTGHEMGVCPGRV